MLAFTANKEQKNALEGLAFWVANEYKCRERTPDDAHEIKKCRDTICECIFPECDQLGIPYWVQNSVIAIGENWRNYANNYFVDLCKTKNIFL